MIDSLYSSAMVSEGLYHKQPYPIILGDDLPSKGDITMRKLMHKINRFYKRYDLTNIGFDIRLTKADMYNYNALMSAYEAIWETMEYYEDETACKFMASLYQDVSDRLFAIENDLVTKPSHKTLAIFKLGVAIFGTMSMGALIAMLIECGFDSMILIGMVCATVLAVCSGIGAYEDIKEV